ncbi:hypothetical protein [Streptomyces sp. NPDC058371]|uniref:hypothetical protein n=1 Tax=Streptomyces sp. NPDC058371 TaxID=3346463 RepID=UPI00364EB672
MPKFVINRKFSSSYREVEAQKFQTVGDYIDFEDSEGIVLRILAKDVHTIERDAA